MATNPVRMVFNVPAVSGEYAPEVLDFSDPAVTGGRSVGINDLSAIVEALPTAAVFELDFLRGSGDRNTEAHWILAQAIYEAVGLIPMLPLAAWYAPRYRCKSGGTDGEGILSVSWD